MVSAAYDYGRSWWDRELNKTQAPVPFPTEKPFPWDELTKLREFFQEFQKLKEAAEKFDKATGQPDCEDPKKAKFVEEVKAKIKELEALVEKNKE